MITMYHWNLPQELQNGGGWENRAMVENFGDKVLDNLKPTVVFLDLGIFHGRAGPQI